MLRTPKLRQHHHDDDDHHQLARHYYRCQHCVLKRFYLCNDMFQVSSSSCFPNRISHANLHVGVFRMDPESRAVKANEERRRREGQGQGEQPGFVAATVDAAATAAAAAFGRHRLHLIIKI